jgi:hypothetical protein
MKAIFSAQQFPSASFIHIFMHEAIVTRRRKALAALEDGTATLQQWQLVPDSIIIAWDASHLVEIESGGAFRVKRETTVRQTSTPHIEDVELTDAPLLTLFKIKSVSLPSPFSGVAFEALHSHTSGVCLFEGPANLEKLKYLRHGLRLIHEDKKPSSNRYKAFHIIKQATKSNFGNSSSSVARFSQSGKCGGAAERRPEFTTRKIPSL